MSESVSENMAESATRPDTVTISIGMDYPGAEISKNHMWRGGSRANRLNKVAKRWKSDLAEAVWYGLLEHGIRKPATPLHIEISGVFWDRAHAIDLQNISELVSDAVEEGTGLNDKDFTVTTCPPEYGAVIPNITVVVTVTTPGKEGK